MRVHLASSMKPLGSAIWRALHAREISNAKRRMGDFWTMMVDARKGNPLDAERRKRIGEFRDKMMGFEARAKGPDTFRESAWELLALQAEAREAVRELQPIVSKISESPGDSNGLKEIFEIAERIANAFFIDVEKIISGLPEKNPLAADASAPVSSRADARGILSAAKAPPRQIAGLEA